MSTSPPSDAERFWSAHLGTIEKRGMSIAEYAREHALSAQSLYGWRRRLRRSASAAPFAEVLVTAAPKAPAPTRESATALTLRLGTAQLAFPELPPAAWLAEVLAAQDCQG